MSPVMESAKGFVLGAVAGGTLGATEGTGESTYAGDHLRSPTWNPLCLALRALGSGTGCASRNYCTHHINDIGGNGGHRSCFCGLVSIEIEEDWRMGGSRIGRGSHHDFKRCSTRGHHWKSEHELRDGQPARGFGDFYSLETMMHSLSSMHARNGNSVDQSLKLLRGEQARLLALEVDLRQRAALELEKRIKACEMKNPEEDGLAAWEAQRREREEIKRQQRKAVELEMQKRTSRQRLLKAVAKYTEFLAFSGIPMTVTAFVTAGFGIFGFGDYRFVFVILLVVVLCMSFWLMSSWRLNFWMLMGCMGMFATFAISVLTVHAGQEVAGMSVKMRLAGQDISNENISIRMTHASSVQAISAGFFVSEVCQVGLGATIGGPVAREAGGTVILGASVTAALFVDSWSVVADAGSWWYGGGFAGGGWSCWCVHGRRCSRSSEIVLMGRNNRNHCWDDLWLIVFRSGTLLT